MQGNDNSLEQLNVLQRNSLTILPVLRVLHYVQVQLVQIKGFLILIQIKSLTPSQLVLATLLLDPLLYQRCSRLPRF